MNESVYISVGMPSGYSGGVGRAPRRLLAPVRELSAAKIPRSANGAPAGAVGPAWRPTVRYVRDLSANSSKSTDSVGATNSMSTERVIVPSAADPRAADSEIPADHFPLAVRFDASRSESPWTCSCLCATAAGPRRLTLSVAAGLALIGAGRHGVVINERDQSVNGPRTS